MDRRRVLCTLSAVVAAVALPAHAQQAVLEVIQLHYRNVDEVIPLLQPLMVPGGTLTGMNSKLIVRTTPANLAEIRQALAALDAAPRRLLISVRQDADVDTSVSGGQISGRVKIGDNAAVSVPGKPTPPGAAVTVDGVQGRVYNSQSAASGRVLQQVQVMEGGQALIRVGQSSPVYTEQVIDTATGRRVMRTSGFQSADVGFYVIPRISGDHVTLEIATAADTLRSPATGAVNVQQVRTTVSGRLGEWIQIGGIDQSGTRHDREIVARSTDARRDNRTILLKVDEVQ